MIYASRCGCHQSSSDKCPCLSLVGHDFLSFAKYPSRLAVTWTRWQAQLIWWKFFRILLTPHCLSPMQFSRGALELESVYSSVWKFQAVTRVVLRFECMLKSEPPQRGRTGPLSKSLAEFLHLLWACCHGGLEGAASLGEGGASPSSAWGSPGCWGKSRGGNSISICCGFCRGGVSTRGWRGFLCFPCDFTKIPHMAEEIESLRWESLVVWNCPPQTKRLWSCKSYA